MKQLPFVIGSLFLFILVSPAVASTTIDVSNNGDGSNTSIDVRTNTGGNFYNGQEVTSPNGSQRTYIKVNDKVLVDETKEGGGETNISVKAEGNKEPEVTYEVKKKDTQSSAVTKDDAKAVSDKIKTELEEKKAAQAEKIKKSLANSAREQASLLSRLEGLFDALRSIFNRN